MLQTENHTPFAVSLFPTPDADGIDTLFLIAKATFTLGRELSVAEEQLPILAADEPWGDPVTSSVRWAGELHLAKPATDVVLVGSAQAPGRKRVEQLDVKLRVGSLRQRVRVFGERSWTSGLLSTSPSRPQLFEMMPLLWENAFGGTLTGEAGDPIDGEPRNPVGRGFGARKLPGGATGSPLPNLEDPADLISSPRQTPAPAGFGFVAPWWQPRASFAGTYDTRWQKERAPFLPADFDPRFFNAAAPGLTAREFLRGGEPLELVNAWERGRLDCRLPACEIGAVVHLGRRRERPPLRLETVLIEPDENRLSLLWRGAVSCDKSLLQVEKVVFGLERMDFVAKAAA